MAIYHLSVSRISRGSGRSAVAAAAYRAGEKLINERDGLTHDYTHKKEVDHSEILAPDHAPEWARDREKLWNEVERSENRKDANTAREIEVALPKELSRENQIELVREYVRENFVSMNMVADVAIHEKRENPHAHIMVTTRAIDEDGFSLKKIDGLDKKENVERWRESWANHANLKLEREGINQRIDHRSYQEQGIEKIPQLHLGAAHKMEARGIETELGNKNREIEGKNKNLEIINKQERELQQEQYKLKREQEKAAEKAAQERRFDLEHKKTPLTQDEAKELAIDRYLERATESKQTELEQVKIEKIDYIQELREVQNNLNKNIFEAEELKRLKREDKDLKIKLKDLKVREIDLKKEIEREKESLLNQEKVKQEIEKQTKEIWRESFLRTANERQINTRLNKIHERIRDINDKQTELEKKLYSDKKIEGIAQAIYTNGETTKLIKERSALNKEKENLEKSIKKYLEQPKPKLFDFAAKKEREQEEERLKAWDKDLGQRREENSIRVNELKQKLGTPEVQKELSEIRERFTLERDVNQQRVNQMDNQLKSLREECKQLILKQVELERGRERDQGLGLEIGFER